MMLGSKMPEMIISQQEADQLAVAICNYLRHQNAVVSQKNLDLMALVAALLMVEGTRVVAIASRNKREKKAKVSASGGVSNIAPFDPAVYPGMAWPA